MHILTINGPETPMAQDKEKNSQAPHLKLIAKDGKLLSSDKPPVITSRELRRMLEKGFQTLSVKLPGKGRVDLKPKKKPHQKDGEEPGDN